MKNCIFENCNFQTSAILLKTRATTISNICSSDLTRQTSDTSSLFLNSDFVEGSFMKFLYSTFNGDNIQINDKRLNINNIIYSKGRCSIAFQYNNFSNFHGPIDDESKSMIDIVSQSCFNMNWNSFSKMDSACVLYVNCQDGDKQSYFDYLGFSNFVDNNFNKNLLRIDLNSNTNFIIDQCVFSNPKRHDNVLTFKKKFRKWLSFCL